METPKQWLRRKGRFVHNMGTERFSPTLNDMKEYHEEMSAMSEGIIKRGDEFTFEHPDYPNSSLKGKILIAGEVTDEYVERFEEGSLNCRQYPKKYCTKVLN